MVNEFLTGQKEEGFSCRGWDCGNLWGFGCGNLNGEEGSRDMIELMSQLGFTLKPCLQGEDNLASLQWYLLLSENT